MIKDTIPNMEPEKDIHMIYIDIVKIETIQNLLESIDGTLKNKRQKPHKLFISHMMVNRRKLGFIDLESLMHSATDTLIQSGRTFTFHLGKHNIIVRCLGSNMEIIQYTLENLCRQRKIPFIPTDKTYITLYKKINFDESLIERP